MQSNEKKFHQTEGHGQLQKGRILADVGTMGTGPQTAGILAGTYIPPPGTNRATKQFLNMMRRPDGVNPIPPITYNEFCEGWKKAKEGTGSNGPHFGHYKAAIKHPYIGPLLYKRSLLPMVTGYSPQRHRMGVDVMLLKKENNVHVDNLRTIVLFDSEANMNFKHLGRRSMHSAINSDQIATEQYSRPHRKAIDHALNRKLMMDHQLYMRQPYAMTSCDLKSCYDRINHSSAGLALQRIGVPRTEIMAMFHTIQQMSHRVKTAFGQSTQAYGGSTHHSKWKLPPQGVLQGNGSGPSIWSILSSNLFHILRDDGFRNVFISSIRQISIELAGFAYVDDTDLVQVDNCPDAVAQKMQRLINKWNDLVSVTGGILAPQKSWWYLVTFKYCKGRWTATDPPTQYALTIRDAQNLRADIQRISVVTGINMLGVHLAPNGTIQDHLSMLRNKAENWAASMNECRANKTEIWTALHRTIPFSIRYSLPAVPLSKENCRYVMAPIYKCGLPRTGIPSTIPVAIRHGPSSMGGLGLMDPYVQMGVEQVETFLSNRWLKTPTGTLLEITLDDLVLEMGIQSPFSSLSILKKGLRYASTPSWIKHMLSFTVDNNISLQLEGIGFSPRRDGDKTIMEIATAYTSHLPTLQAINRVRMYQRVIWISDIATADGQKVDHRCINEGTTSFFRNKYNWPMQHHTTKLDWQRWRQMLRELCLPNNWKLRQPLGPWTLKQDEWFDTWDCMVTKDRERLYVRTADGQLWKRHIKTQFRNQRTSRYYSDFLLHHSINESVEEMDRASIKTQPRCIELLDTSGQGVWKIDEPKVFYDGPLPATRQNILRKIQDTLQPEFMDATEDISKLLQDFAEGTTISVSDGSYYPEQHRAAGAWVIESSCRQQWIMCAMTVPGPSEYFTSYRSELMGLLGITVTLRIMAMCTQAPRHCIIGCDGKAALQSLLLKRENISANTNNADIICITRDIWDSFQTQPIPIHVDGHQDTYGRSLTRLAKMNIMMDKLATLTATHYLPKANSWSIPHVGLPTVRHQHMTIGGSLSRTLYHALTAATLWEYISTKVFNTGLRYQQVSWTALKYARGRLPTGVSIFVSKWISNTIATGVVMQRRKHRVFNRCPRCNHWGEDKTHVLRCWDIRAKVIWDTRFTALTQTLREEKTHPDIENFIIDGLKNFRRTTTHGLSELPEEWMMEQQQIGWMNFLSGFVSQKMVLKQQLHYRHIGSRKRGHTWAGKVILQGWTLIHNMWIGRNEVLHTKEVINDISGEALLDIEIESEYDKGCADLPRMAHKWFTQPKEQLLASSISYKKGWLLIIKTIKETLHIADYSIFSSSKALRKWIGLQQT